MLPLTIWPNTLWWAWASIPDSHVNIPALYIVNTVTPNGINAYHKLPFIQLGLGFTTFLKIIIKIFIFLEEF